MNKLNKYLCNVPRRARECCPNLGGGFGAERGDFLCTEASLSGEEEGEGGGGEKKGGEGGA